MGRQIYRQSKDYIFIARNCEKIYAIAAILMLLIGYLSKEEISYTGLIFVVFFLGIFVFITGRHLKTITYEIILDFGATQISLRSCLRHKSFLFDEINRISVNGNISITLQDGQKFTSSIKDENLLKDLNRIKSIEWGRLCALFGPSEEIRSSIDRS